MIVLALEEFAAKRRKRQEDIEKDLRPYVDEALENLTNGLEDWAGDLAAQVVQLFHQIFVEEGGLGDDGVAATKFLTDLRKALDKTTPDSRAELISIWLATATLNAATMAAAATDEEFIVMEWVTMHDDSVRETHEDVEGHQRPPGEPFIVGGEEMLYPGQPVADLALWVNCRCALRPALAGDVPFAQTELEPEGDDMTEQATEEVEVQGLLPWHGVLAPEGKWSGDGRMFTEDSLRFRDLPLPLTWQKASSDGHSGSVVIGRIDSIERVDGEMRGAGVFLAIPEADEFVGILSEFGKFGVSVDADDAEFEFDEETGKMSFVSARIASASVVAIPAFAEAYVALGAWGEEALAASAEFKRGPGWLTDPVATKRLHDYWTKPGEEGFIKIGWGKGGDFNRCRLLVGEKIAENSPEDLRFLNQICAQWHHDALGIWPGEHLSAADTIENAEVGPALTLVASGGWCAPSEFFKDPELKEPTPLTITDDGRVFGHAAEWTTCHIGYDGVCQTPPHSSTGYSQFLLGDLPLDDGTSIPAGNLTIGAGHAPAGLRARGAMAHYDNTASVFAYVTCGEDVHGIWFSGCLKPGLTDEQITEAKMAKISGDWRGESEDKLEMVAMLAVNTPGFAVPRIRIAASNGRQISLVAAGIVKDDPKAETFDINQIAEAVVTAMENRQKRREKITALATRFEKEA